MDADLHIGRRTNELNMRPAEHWRDVEKRLDDRQGPLSRVGHFPPHPIGLFGDLLQVVLDVQARQVDVVFLGDLERALQRQLRLVRIARFPQAQQLLDFLDGGIGAHSSPSNSSPILHLSQMRAPSASFVIV